MAAMLWIFLYNPTAGYLNYVLERIPIAGPNWLGDPRWALVAVAMATVWRELGFNVIFFLAGLSSIPRDLLEAAAIDGAGKLQRFRYVVLPNLSPTLFFVTVVSVINSFQSFGQIHVLTQGGPANATNVLVYKLYLDAFTNFRTGFASAEAVLLFGIVLLATGIQFRIAKRRVHYG
jgi:ABC-type sugar transport system permease subunit